VSGWTFAVAGEEDLDRIVRLQEPVCLRSHGPDDVGVVVRGVSFGERSIPDHPLIEARVDLLDEPKFEGRNGILSEDASEFIDPFHLQIEGGGVKLRRKALWYPRNEAVKIYEVDPSVLKQRQPVEDEPVDPTEIADATGIMDYVEHLQERKNKLEADLEPTQDPVTQTALQKRIDDLNEGLDNRDIRVRILGAGLRYRLSIRGPAEVVDQAEALGGIVGTSPPWLVEFWMGGWDADALCGYMRGSLQVPFRPNQDNEPRT
jgi:hypothetical protein